MRNSECGTRNGSERLRALNVPRRVEVELGPDGLPKTVVRSGGQAVGDCDVEAVIETWHGGGRVVLFQDLVTDEWFIQKP